MKKTISIAVFLFLSVFIFAKTPKYIIYMIGDGMGLNQVQATNQYNRLTGREPLSFTGFPVHTFISTYSANRLVTDSAAAGTALATGKKVNNQAIGWNETDGDLTSVADWAKASGAGVGIITNVGLNHATPAAFYGCSSSRGDYDLFIDQFLESPTVDFLAGSTILTTKGSSATPQSQIEKVKSAGVRVVQGSDGFRPSKERTIMLGDNLARTSLLDAIDRKEGDLKLADFTASALDYLYANFKKGFFLMVEGGDIDHVCHANDGASMVAEINDFDVSVRLALDFYAKHPDETLIIVTADHETGGLSQTYKDGDLRVADMQTVSKSRLTRSIEKLGRNGEDVSWSDVRKVLSECTGLYGALKPEASDHKAISDAYKKVFIDMKDDKEVNLYTSNNVVVAEALKCTNKLMGLTWQSLSHSGSEVGVWVKGAGSDSFVSCKDNTDIPGVIAKVARYKR